MELVSLGVLFAFGAMLFWGFGDFLIQKSARKIGDWETVFLITLTGAIILIPFIYKDIVSLNSGNFLILLVTGIALFVASMLDLEALKRGKLSVVEPIYSLEIPVVVILAFVIISESIAFFQLATIFLLVLGLFMVSLKTTSRKVWLEKGVVLVLIGSIIMGVANFLVGFSSRITDPLLTIWFSNLVIASFSLIYLIYNKKIENLFKDINKNKKLLTCMSIFDNFAWIAFAFAMTLSPIAIAVALSESYIIIAVLLGMFINKEKMKNHQKIGLILSVIAAITLAVTI